MGAITAHSEYDILQDIIEHAYTLRKEGVRLSTDTAYNRVVSSAVDVVRTFEKRLRVRYQEPDAHEATTHAVAALMGQATDMDEFAQWLDHMARHPRSSRSFLDVIISDYPCAVPRTRSKNVRIRPPRDGEYRHAGGERAPVIDIADWCMRARYA